MIHSHNSRLMAALGLALTVGIATNIAAVDSEPAPMIDNPALNPVAFDVPPEGDPVVLVEDGEPRAVILVNPVHEPREREVVEKRRAGIEQSVTNAAEDLQHYIREATGATLPILSPDEDPGDSTAILVGHSRFTDAHGVAVKGLEPSGFIVRTLADGVAIVGRDANIDPEYYAESGTLWGVYDFLERFVGIRWYYPGELGTVIPQRSDLVIEPVQYRDHPHFLKRRYGRFHGALRNPMPPRSDDARRVGATFRNEELSGLPMGVHTFRHWEGEYGEDHPEYFERDTDGRILSGNLCYSEPAVLEQLLENAAEDGREFISVSPNDAPLQCQCSRCRERMNPNDFLGEYSQVVGEFVYELAVEVERRWPDRTVTYLPYQNYTKPPEGIVFPDNVVVHICHTRPLAFHKEPRIYEEETAVVEGWKDALSRPLGHYHYVNTWPDEDTAAPFQFRHTMQRFFQDHRDSFGTNNDGVLVFDWARHHLMTYLMMRLLWNPDFDVDAAFEEYCELMYGDAAGTVKGVFDILNDRWEQSRWSEPLPPYHFLDLRSVHSETYPPEVVDELRDLYARARDQAGETGLEAERVAYLGNMLEPFFEESETFHAADKERMLSVHRVDTLPTLDGELDRGFWEGVPAQAMGQGYDATAPPPEISTRVRGVWDDTGVVFAFELEEPDMANIKATVTSREGRAYSDDSIEMFLDPTGTRGDFFHLAANSLETLFDGRWSSNPYSAWEADGVEAVVHKGEGEWWLEVSIPLATLDAEPIEAGVTHWFGNFTRSRWRDSFELYRLRTADVPPRRSNNLNMNHFGRIVFVE